MSLSAMTARVDMVKTKTRQKDFLTTGEVARLLGVASMTVINYCKRGELAVNQSTLTGYRRIPREAVLEFMKKRSMPTDALEAAFSKAPPKVLIADDDPDVRWSIAETVKQLWPGARIVEAADGYAACLEAGALAPDLVTLDLQMPQMNGFEVCASFRKSAATRQSRILVVTTFSSRDNVDEFRRLGADDFLSKPFKPAELKAKLAQLVPVEARAHAK